MESISEIQNMRVSELKEFLRRNGKDISTIERNDGKSGPPRKSDLLGAAITIRTDYDNPIVDGPTSPQNARQRNIFQSGYSPKSARSTPAKDAIRDVGTPLRSAKKKSKRRSSVGWVNPAFLAKLTPKSTPVAASPAASESRMEAVQEPEDDVETYANDFGDEGDQIIQSDYDSTGTAGSGIDSDGGSSVVDTDEDEFSSVNQFKFMKAYEVRAWLTENNVPFNHRSKKAELISIATAHALYLEAHAGDDEDKVEKMKAKAAEVEPKDDDEIQIVENPVPVPSLPLRQQRIYKKKEREEVDTIEELPVSSVRARKSRRSAKRKPIQAPKNEDVVEAVPKEDEILPVKQSKSSRRRKQSEATVQTANQPPPRRRVQPRVSLPKFRMPKISVTKHGILTFLTGCVFIALVVLCIQWWRVMTRPFCDTYSSSTRMKDGRECRPCPQYGKCSGGELSCEKNYRIEGRMCVEDSAVNDYALYLENSMVKTMAGSKGVFACDASVTYKFDEVQLRNMFKESNLTSCPRSRLEVLKKKKLNVSKFEPAFEKAVTRMRKNRKLKFTKGKFEAVDGQKQASCILWLFFVRHFMKIFGGFVLSILILKYRIDRYLKKRHEARVENIYRQACDILREVKLQYSDDEKGDAFMRDTELRTEILGRYSNKSGKLWVEAEEFLKSDMRVQHSSRTIQGRPCYIYEWKGNLRRPSVGAYLPYGSSDAESRRRLSFGSRGYDSASPHGYTPRTGVTPRGSPRGFDSTPRPSPGGYGSGYSSASPMGRAPPMTPNSSAPSPGYARLLNLWREN